VARMQQSMSLVENCHISIKITINMTCGRQGSRTGIRCYAKVLMMIPGGIQTCIMLSDAVMIVTNRPEDFPGFRPG
jgi:hypothetical protein